MTSTKRRLARAIGWAMLMILAGFAMGAAPASAGTYTVRGCWSDGSTGGWTPLPPVSDDWYTLGGCSSGRDLAVGFVGPHGQAPQGTTRGWKFTSPPGTSIAAFEAHAVWMGNSMWWSRGLLDADSGAWLASFTPAAPGDSGRLISVQGLTATSIVAGVRCDIASCQLLPPIAPYLWRDWTGIRDVVVTVRDDVPPTLAVVQAPPETWEHDGQYPVSFGAEDGVGVSDLYVFVDSSQFARLVRDCYEPSSNTAAQPCAAPGAALSATLDTGSLSEGVHVLHLKAKDAAGNLAETVRRVFVDRTAPAAPQALALAGGDAWRRDNRFSVRWRNPPLRVEAPIASARYELCPSGNQPFDHTGCVTGWGEGADLSDLNALSVPGNGTWTLTLALRDAADNFDADRAAVLTQPLRLDTDRPVAWFLPLDPRDPTHIPLTARDVTSGVAAVDVEARLRGESVWRTLPVTRDGDRFAAALADDTLPVGTYELRAHVADAAGNEMTATALQDGTPLTLRLPLRASSTLAVGQPRRVKVKGSRGAPPRYRLVLVTRPSSRYGAPVTLEGRLTDAAGNPRGNAAVDVFERVDLPGLEWRQLASVRTAAAGGFSFKALPGPDRVLSFRYPGTATTLPGSETVTLRVRAGVTLAPSRSSVRNGDAVVFRGRLRGGPIPAAGKLLALQARTSSGWTTFATPRASARTGRWAHRYRFTGTPVTARYAFRVLVPAGSDYPYAQGASAVAHVLVRGNR
jgi:hypothetical protein